MSQRFFFINYLGNRHIYFVITGVIDTLFIKIRINWHTIYENLGRIDENTNSGVKDHSQQK